MREADEKLDRAFAALADPTRRAIVERLAERPMSVGEVSKPFGISAPAISRHLRVLEEAGLIRRDKRQQHRICRLTPEGLKRASDWVEHYRRLWEGRLDALGRYMADLNARKEKGNDSA